MTVKAQLTEMRFEFTDYVISGKVENGGRLDLQLCAFRPGSNDAAKAQQLANRLNEKGFRASRLQNCGECMSCSLGCFVVESDSFENRLVAIASAAYSVLDSYGKNLELTYRCGDTFHILSTDLQYQSPGWFCAKNIWTYYMATPPEALLTALRGVPGVSGLVAESIYGTDHVAINLHISTGIGLEPTLGAVATVLAS